MGDAEGAAALEQSICCELGTKHFLHDSDRAVAMGIFQSFLARRVLSDAIYQKDVDEVRRHLALLVEKGLHATLDEPIDAYLNTLLHIAVQVRCATTVQELLLHGARADLHNLHGDRPSQKFLFPRLGRGAMLCRSSAPLERCRVVAGPTVGRICKDADEIVSI